MSASTNIIPPAAPATTSAPIQEAARHTESPMSTPPRKSSAVSSNKDSGDFGHDSITNTIPTQDILKKIEDYPVLDVNGKSVPFKSIYTGPNVARRVLVIFIRHFFCGNCQEYLRTLSSQITPDSLLALPIPTFIAVIGCGSPSLIKTYAETTSCPFPIYADPTKNLYNELGMTRTLNMGPRPEYQRKGVAATILSSLWSNVKEIPTGKAFAGGDYQQVGGEFLFEPLGELVQSPIASPISEDGRKQLGGDGATTPVGRLDKSEEKRVTWCHRMKNTRDHAEIPELREVLGLDGEGLPGRSNRRWWKALNERKGTGVSQMSGLSKTPSGNEVLTGEPRGSPERMGSVEIPTPVLEDDGKVPIPTNS